MIRKALPLLSILLFASAAKAASAQTTPPPTPLERQLHKLDLSVQGAGIFTHTVSGTIISGLSAPNQGESMTEIASSTLGALVTIRFPAKPYFGLEFNYGYSRFTENFEGPAVASFLPVGTTDYPIQADVGEYTLGYLVEIPYTIDGLQPIFSAGLGTTAFKPTPLGGEEEQEKARMTYYYSAGVQKSLSSHFGLRMGFRQLFYLAPDFGQNYLVMLQHTTTYEPTAGFYIRY
ncbi:MAG: outer membrane beta-barrel protein [Acidobacteriaceae bacterium]